LDGFSTTDMILWYAMNREVRELEQRRIAETKSLAHELTLSKQLNDLYKRAADEEKKRVIEVQHEHERLTDQLNEATESHRRALQKLSADLKTYALFTPTTTSMLFCDPDY
jgi:DNA repair exonuclease SbcCD ATPase subunit